MTMEGCKLYACTICFAAERKNSDTIYRRVGGDSIYISWYNILIFYVIIFWDARILLKEDNTFVLY